MYKVFVNKQSVSFVEKGHSEISDKEDLTLKFQNFPEFWDTYLAFINEGKYDNLQIVCKNARKIFRRFLKRFHLIPAAGGLVLNDKNEVLLIYRSGFWDLPKGKIEKGETRYNAAIREVEEETGISGLSISRKLTNTYHWFTRKGKSCIKLSFWYEMRTDSEVIPVPQTEESITEVRWVKSESLDQYLLETYPSIKELIEWWSSSIPKSGLHKKKKD